MLNSIGAAGTAGQTGLVIVFPPGIQGLFNPEIYRLVGAVQDKLDDVYVTYALSGGSSPNVDAAVNAARFAGCGSAVIIHSEDWIGDDRDVDTTSDSTFDRREHDLLELGETADRVVQAYELVRASSGMAA